MKLRRLIHRLEPWRATNVWQAVLAVLVSVLIGYQMVRVFATGPSAAFLVSNATVSGNAVVVANGTAIGGHMVQFVSAPTPMPTPAPSTTPTPTATPGPGPTPTPGGGTQTLNCIPVPHRCGFPDATNTGVRPGHTLTWHPGDLTITTPNTSYSDLDIEGSLNIRADHVTVSNVRVRATFGDGGCLCGSYDTLTDSEIGGGANGTTFTGLGSAIYSGGDANVNLIQRVNIHHADDGLRIDGGTTVRDTYIHDLSNGLNGSHNDDNQSCVGTHMSFIHNTFFGGNNDPIFLQGGDCGSNDNFFLDYVVVDNNLLTCLHEPNNISGYGISVGRGRHVQITNNQFDRGWEAAVVGIYLPNTMVQADGVTATSASNWGQNHNIYDDNGAALGFPGN